MRLARDFYDRPVLSVARDLLGRDVRSGPVVLRLVEVEAYRGADDPGSHAFRGPTPRNTVMFGEPGHLYVYFTYGMHWCANVVCQPSGEAAAVLLRAASVVAGLDVVRERRGDRGPDRDLARGPARLTRALGIDGSWNGTDLVGGALTLEEGTPVPDALVRSGPRVGINGAGAPTPWRFWIDGDPAVSPYRPGVARRRRTPAGDPRQS